MINERDRCIEAYENRCKNRPFGLTVEGGNAFLAAARRDRDRCLAEAVESGRCKGIARPTIAPSILARAGISAFNPNRYTCGVNGWTYKLNEAEYKLIDAYEVKEAAKPMTPTTCKDYSTAHIAGIAVHVWDVCGKPYYIDYLNNKKVWLKPNWWNTYQSRQNTDAFIDYSETHIDPNPIPDPIPIPDPDSSPDKVPWYDICGRVLGPIVGKQKECKIWDVTCHGENVTKRITGSLGHMACWAGIALVAVILVLFALFGRKKATSTIIHVTKEGATTAKHGAKAAAGATGK